jgi:hypothetical protein
MIEKLEHFFYVILNIHIKILSIKESDKNDFLQQIQTIKKLNDYFSEDYKKTIIQMKEELESIDLQMN